jgi:hypothetical protein
MSIGKCNRCGETTNSATSNLNYRANPPVWYDGCYARHVNGKWERGCIYDDAGPFEKAFADSVINCAACKREMGAPTAKPR